MIKALKQHWKIYLIEAWALGMFMISACLFVIIIEHPNMPIRTTFSSNIFRRMLIGVAMGTTAILLIYSKWGKLSGAHMNPAVTLAQYQLDRIKIEDATWYIIFQFLGGIIGIAFIKLLLPTFVAAPPVNYVLTSPAAGNWGIEIAFIAELLLAFLMLTMVLVISNKPKISPYTGYFVGLLVMLFITFEAPISGMSINPARTLSSALWANDWSHIYLYFLAPIIGMQVAAWLFRHNYRIQKGECKSLKIHMSGNNHNSPIYKVLWYSKK